MNFLRSTIKAVLPNSVVEARRNRLRMQSEAAAAERVQEKRRAQEQTLWMSQAGQDLWVYGNVFNEKKNGFFLDLGAHDGVYLSNTFLLETRFGWNGILIEANPTTFEALRANRTGNCVNACVSSKKETVRFAHKSTFGGIIAEDCDVKGTEVDDTVTEMTTVPLEELLDEAGAPSKIDYLSIDIEGAEDRALLEFPFERYSFTCITIERPSEALRSVFDQHGYVVVAEIPGLDSFFIHETHRQAYFDNTLGFFGQRLSFSRSKLAEPFAD